MRTLPVTLAIAVLAVTLPGQRGKPTLELQKRKTTIEYGAVPVGKHSLDELAVGNQWRLGMNNASTWSLEMPILVGDRVLAPGEYRINLHRIDDKRCAVVAQGSGLALGGGQDLGVEGELGRTDKPSKKLAIEWQQDPGKDKDALPARLLVRFGEHEWQGGLSLIGGKTTKVSGWQLTVFAVPADAVARREQSPVPVAVLSRRGGSKAPEGWNLVVGGSEVRLVPWMAAPTDSFGFGEVQPPDAAWTTTGTVAAADAQIEEPIEHLELRESALEKGTFELQFAAGKQTLTVSVPEPKGKPK